MNEEDRNTLLSFLSGAQGSEYTPSSGEVTGILKQMGDEMGAGLAEATATEKAAIKSYNELMAAKTKEVQALSKSIEAKLRSVGELSVSIAQMKNELTDTEEALLADQAFLAGLDKACAGKKAEWEEREKTRSSASSSFMQVRLGAGTARARALAAVEAAKR